MAVSQSPTPAVTTTIISSALFASEVVKALSRLSEIAELNFVTQLIIEPQVSPTSLKVSSTNNDLS